MLAVKRSAGVAPEVDLYLCTLHLLPQKANKAEPTLVLKPRNHQKSKTGVPLAPKKDMCPPKILKKKYIYAQV